MTNISRKTFLSMLPLPFLIGAGKQTAGTIQAVNGTISSKEMGLTLVHEHFLVDFIGAVDIHPGRWDRKEVVKKVLPFLLEAKKSGVRTIFDCTPAYLGRDIPLLVQLQEASGLNIVTNTGYYGAVQNKYLPVHALSENAEQLSQRWITEFRSGIDGTSIKPGFIKTSVDPEVPMSDVHQTLIRAAALTHLQTGLTICSHTGAGKAAFAQLDILEKQGVRPDAFVWVHAQMEEDHSLHSEAANRGCWISLDGMGWGHTEVYLKALTALKNNNLFHRVLISHDAGWYKPEDPSAVFIGYSDIFVNVIPQLKLIGFSDSDIDQLLIKNPAEAFSIRVRKR